MRASRYGRQEATIGANDGDTIICRWKYGHMLLRDEKRITPQRNLRHGVIAELIEIARRAGYNISEREIQYRLKCARAYATEAEIRRASADFRHWWDLIRAGFPPIELPLDEADAEPYDPRNNEEVGSDNRRTVRRALEQHWQEMLPGFYPDITLAEAQKKLYEQRELTSRRIRLEDECAIELQRLIDAVDGDLTATVEDAWDALEDPEEEEPDD